MAVEQVLIGGQWREANHDGTFHADNPALKQPLPAQYPVSTWADVDEALAAAAVAFQEMRQMAVEKLGLFLNRFADLLDENKQALCELANQESGLPVSPRLLDVEMPRTINQLRLAAAAAVEGSWRMATIDSKAGIRSYYAGIGPVAVFGPNNFPLAFSGAAGGDFAAAIAAGNPVIVKANPAQPGTTRELTKLAFQAVQDCGLPPAAVQLIYHMPNEDGLKFVADPRLGAIGFTGSKGAGLKLKEAADKVGKPIYLELSSINPVVILPGALAERGEALATEFQTSCLMAAGQFCTNPGLVILLDDDKSAKFVDTVKAGFAGAPSGTLLGKGVEANLTQNLKLLIDAGADVEASGSGEGSSQGYTCPNTLLSTSAEKFLANPEAFQTEAFGNSSLIVKAANLNEVCAVIDSLEGNLTGTIYSDTAGSDDPAYDLVALHLRVKVGRLIDDKMPTGVAVSAAMNHGGPFPATGHPGFTAVGIPASIHRFAMLQSFDNVRPSRLPRELQNENPTGSTWRLVDGAWTTESLA
ncbi:aldehyde dehydrogenase family protein [Bremerella sp. JC817]|uniref:aldehyde dehydrogenase family protein n=1 Tax=Bremerella sp. JC817 TaxID=3231756 RepID=UPI0034582701